MSPSDSPAKVPDAESMDVEPTLSRPRFRNANFVKLIVSSAENCFFVHEELICNVSPVFKAAFQGKFSEGTEKSMKLPEDDTDAVEHLVEWIYRQKLQTANTESSETSEAYWVYLVKLYGLADKYDVADLKTPIYDQVYSISNQMPTSSRIKPPQTEEIAYLYANSSKPSKFRELVVAWYVTRINFEWYNRSETSELLASIPEFASDVCCALANKMKSEYVDPLSALKDSAPTESTFAASGSLPTSTFPLQISPPRSIPFSPYGNIYGAGARGAGA